MEGHTAHFMSLNIKQYKTSKKLPRDKDISQQLKPEQVGLEVFIRTWIQEVFGLNLSWDIGNHDGGIHGFP
jgi:hypothetical protein